MSKKGSTFTKDFWNDFIAAVMVIAVYGGVVLTIVGPCFSKWSWCWLGILLCMTALIVLAVMSTRNDLCGLAKYHTHGRVLWLGLKIVGKAVCSLFIYFMLPIAYFASWVVGSIKRLVVLRNK